MLPDGQTFGRSAARSEQQRGQTQLSEPPWSTMSGLEQSPYTEVMETERPATWHELVNELVALTRRFERLSARALRSDVRNVLRRVEAGERLRVMVAGRPVAELVPLPTRPTSLSWEEFERNLGTARADAALAADLAALLTDTTDDLP